MVWEQLKYSRGEINKAGRKLSKEELVFQEDKNKAMDILDN